MNSQPNTNKNILEYSKQLTVNYLKDILDLNGLCHNLNLVLLSVTN